MKKFFIAIVALAAAVSCSNDDIISIDRQTIGFGNAFVDNATRIEDPSYGADNLIDAFKVYGTVTGNTTGNTINLYNGADVTRDGKQYNEAWTCSQEEYWIPSATYNFVAVANATSVAPATGLPATISYTADGTSDLLYTKTGVTAKTNAQAEPTEGVNGNKVVAFTFNHLLSKVHFNFVVEDGTSEKFTFNISDLQISGAIEKGIYTITDGTWAKDGDGTKNFSFGNTTGVAKDAPQTSANACLIIPGEQTWKVSFKCTTFYNGTEMSTDECTGDLTHTFVENGAYVINVELSAGLPISFSVGSLGSWDAKTSISIP